MNADTVPEREGKRLRWDFYICTHKKNSREQTCQAGRVGAAALDQAVIENLMTHVLTVENLRPIADALANSLADRNYDVSMRITAIQAELDEVQKAIRLLLDAIEKMGLSANIQARLREREEEERHLIAQLVNLEDALIKPKDVPQIGEQQLTTWIESIRASLTGDDLDLARQAIRQFVAKVVVNAKAGTLYYTFPLSHCSRVGALPPGGHLPLPRYFRTEFRIQQVAAPARVRREEPRKAHAREQVQAYRALGMSYSHLANSVNHRFDYPHPV